MVLGQFDVVQEFRTSLKEKRTYFLRAPVVRTFFCCRQLLRTLCPLGSQSTLRG